MIDFTNLPTRNKAYGGANGGKKCVVYNNELYMVKFPPLPKKNKALSYGNNCISEYLGSQIYQLLGIPVQETILGTYTINNKEKIVVACKDFTSPGIVLQDFASMKNQTIDSLRNGYGTELSDILYTFEDQSAIDKRLLTERFWDMFIVDAFIGNWDRHNGNWGFLYNTENDLLSLAPVYDCGSSLFPQANEELMKKILQNKNEINHRIFDIPTSAIIIDDKRINYFKFISSLELEECNNALKRIVPRIKMNEIENLIDGTSLISDLQKTFYKTMLNLRKERILDYSLELLKKRDIETKENLSKTIDSCEKISIERNTSINAAHKKDEQDR